MYTIDDLLFPTESYLLLLLQLTVCLQTEKESLSSMVLKASGITSGITPGITSI